MTSLVEPDSPIGPLHLRLPPRVEEGAPLADVARQMRQDEVSLVLVGPGVGAVLTERDLVAGLARGLGPDAPAAEVASRDLVTARTSTPLGTAIFRMLDHGIRHLVVVDDEGSLAGVLALREATRMLVHSLDPGRWRDGQSARTPELRDIPPHECLTLLRGEPVGRLAVVAGDTFESCRPEIFPVNYAIGLDNSIMIRTDAGTKLENADMWPVAFEVDGLDPSEHTGWSVVVLGRANDVTEAIGPEMDELRRVPLTTWASGERGRWLRIRPEVTTGRRIIQKAEDR